MTGRQGPVSLRERLYDATFAISSVANSFFLGRIVGAIASGRVPPGIAEGAIWRSLLNPTSRSAGLLATGVCAYLAAVYLIHDARRAARRPGGSVRRRALITGVVIGAGGDGRAGHRRR